MTDDPVRARARPHDTQIGGLRRPVLAGGLVTLLAVVFAVGLTGLPRESAGLPAIARHAMQIALPKWGTTEVVSEIVYGSRGFDTFGETFILIAAVVGVVVLARSREYRGEYVGEQAAGAREQQQEDPGGSEGSATERAEEHGSEPLPDPDRIPIGARAPEPARAMTVVVRTAARPAAVILSVAGVYLAAWGYTPGGGFPAGVALTGVVILLYAALGRAAVRTVVRPSVLEPVEMVTALAIIALGGIGLWQSRSFFGNWVPLAQQQTIYAGGNQQVFSGLELVEVAVSITIAVFALLGMGHDWADDESATPGGGEDESEE